MSDISAPVLVEQTATLTLRRKVDACALDVQTPKTGARTNKAVYRGQTANDDKVLHFQACIKTGWLNKMGAAGLIWKKRWFMYKMELNALLYYKDQQEEKSKGTIPLDDVVSVAPTKTKDKEFCFQIQLPNRSYHLQAENQKEMEEWIALVEFCKTLLDSRAFGKQVNTISDSHQSIGLPFEVTHNKLVSYDALPTKKATLQPIIEQEPLMQQNRVAVRRPFNSDTSISLTSFTTSQSEPSLATKSASNATNSGNRHFNPPSSQKPFNSTNVSNLSSQKSSPSLNRPPPAPPRPIPKQSSPSLNRPPPPVPTASVPSSAVARTMSPKGSSPPINPNTPRSNNNSPSTSTLRTNRPLPPLPSSPVVQHNNAHSNVKSNIQHFTTNNQTVYPRGNFRTTSTNNT